MAVFTCPNNTIYDEKKTQCLPQNETTPCRGEITANQLKRGLLENSLPPVSSLEKTFCRLLKSNFQIPVSANPLCPFEGYQQLNDGVCETDFIKCSKPTPYGNMEAHLSGCPEGYIYYPVSKRCERKTKIIECQNASSANSRWNLPVELIDKTYN